MVDLKDAWTQYIDQWEWEYFVSLNLPQGMPEGTIYRLVQRDFVRPIAELAKDQIAAIGVVNQYRSDHIHLGMMSKGHRLESDLERRIVESEVWEADKMDIQIVHESEGVSDYMARNLTLNRPDQYDVVHFNSRMLNNTRGVTSARQEEENIRWGEIVGLKEDLELLWD